MDYIAAIAIILIFAAIAAQNRKIHAARMGECKISHTAHKTQFSRQWTENTLTRKGY